MINEVVTPNKPIDALSEDELRRLTDFFSILIEIDKRNKKKEVVLNDTN